MISVVINFLSVTNLFPSQHFFPNSLALNITCLSCQTPSRGSVSNGALIDSGTDSPSGGGGGGGGDSVIVAQGLGIDILGLQRQTLIDLQQMGPSAISEPQSMYKQCLLAGLLNGFVGPNNNVSLGSSGSAGIGVAGGSGSPSTSAQRDALLSLILSHGLVGFLSACATGG